MSESLPGRVIAPTYNGLQMIVRRWATKMLSRQFAIPLKVVSGFRLPAVSDAHVAGLDQFRSCSDHFIERLASALLGNRFDRVHDKFDGLVALS